MNELFLKFRELLPALWLKRWWGLATTLALGTIGAAIVMAIPNKYEATARVFVDTQSILKPLMAGLAVQPNVDQQVQMMARTLISRPNVERVVRMSDQALAEGVDRLKIDGVDVPVFNAARTVVDCFRFRNKIGLDVALEALRDGWTQRKFTLDDVWLHATRGRVANVMRPYIEAITA